MKLFDAVYNLLCGNLVTLPLPGGNEISLSLTVLMLIPTGILFTILTKGLPVRLFPEMIRVSTEKKTSTAENSISGQALKSLKEYEALRKEGKQP